MTIQNQLTEEDLDEAFREDAEFGLELLHEEFRDRIARYIKKCGPSLTSEEIKDLYQDTMLEMVEQVGHFYLPDHRKNLLRGRMHNSQSDFRSKDPWEQEADEFAASLLMPKELFVAQVRLFRQNVCTLKEICTLAETRFHTSITSTARRYVQCDIEACAIVVSQDGKVRWAMYSEDMSRLNMKYVQFGAPVPRMSKTADLWTRMDIADDLSILEGSVEADIWFECPDYRKGLWEEVLPLGHTGFVLTYLTLEEPL